MARIADDRYPTLSEVLAWLNNDDLRVMVNWLSVPKPRPTRKADMVAAIARRLSGASLRCLWDGLDELQRLAVGEALHDPKGYAPDRFRARYGALPPGFDRRVSPAALPLRLFLHYGGAHTGSTPFIPADLAKSLRGFVPPPPEPTLASEDDLPEAVDRRRRGFVPRGSEPEYDRIELVRRDMERAAQRDLAAVLRLIDLGRVKVSARTGRASAAAAEAIAGELDGGDFFALAEKRERRDQEVGPPLCRATAPNVPATPAGTPSWFIVPERAPPHVPFTSKARHSGVTANTCGSSPIAVTLPLNAPDPLMGDG